MRAMKRDLQALATEHFDVLIIGGGILGAGIARDATLRGLRVALIDKGDFAGGTSSRTSKLIHGGFRYLEQRAFGLVAESCRERRILRELAPERVRPQPFLLPVYEGNRHSLGMMRLGMTLYDLLARYQNVASHQTLTAARALQQEPTLEPRGLRGAILFYDCQEDDARFCLDNTLHAAELGTVCANYCELTGFDAGNGRIRSARVNDKLTGNSFEIVARSFVNATGPWIERVAGLVGQSFALSPTKGVHLVLPRLTEKGIFFQSKTDGRMMFIVPFGDCSLVGTTDTDFSGNPDDVHASPADVEYLLRELTGLLPARKIDVITTYAGVRPLLRAAGRTPSARSREHRLAQAGANLISVAGGKYTTYRAIAAEVVDAVYGLLGNKPVRCRTAETPIPCRPPVRADDIAYFCENEMAMTVTDVMRRRTPLALSRQGGPEMAERVAKAMAMALGWNDEQMRRSLQEYVDEWKRNLP